MELGFTDILAFLAVVWGLAAQYDARNPMSDRRKESTPVDNSIGRNVVQLHPKEEYSNDEETGSTSGNNPVLRNSRSGINNSAAL